MIFLVVLEFADGVDCCRYDSSCDLAPGRESGFNRLFYTVVQVRSAAFTCVVLFVTVSCAFEQSVLYAVVFFFRSSANSMER